MRDLRQSSGWANYLKSIGWKIEIINGNYIYLKKIPLLGWFIKIQRPEKILTCKDINILEKNYKPFQISFEPKHNNLNLIKNCKFKIENHPSLPTKTLQVDLTKSEEDLLKSFSQKTRYNTRLSSKKRVTVEKSTNILEFVNFWHQNFEKKRFLFFSQKKNILALRKVFGKNSHLLFAKKKNELVGVLFLLFLDKVAYYMYAATNDEGRKNFAPTILTWEAIRLSKRLGITTFDFDGIYDERFPIKTWLGFTKFKKGFGGKEIFYPGRFVKNKIGFKI